MGQGGRLFCLLSFLRLHCIVDSGKVAFADLVVFIKVLGLHKENVMISSILHRRD